MNKQIVLVFSVLLAISPANHGVAYASKEKAEPKVQQDNSEPPSPQGVPLIKGYSQDSFLLQNVPIGQETFDKLKAERLERERIEAENIAKKAAEAAKEAALRAENEKKRMEADRIYVTKRQSSYDILPVREKARAMVVEKWGEGYWEAFDQIISHESGWNPNAYNSSGACGLPQALPCSKMGGMDVDNQLRWAIGYIGSRYGNPINAWYFWQSHNWY